MLSPLVLFLVFGYLATVAIETPVLLVGLRSSTSAWRRVQYGFLLTAFTYPFVAIILPVLIAPYGRPVFLLVAETFAPVAEVLLFRFLIQRSWNAAPDHNDVAIVIANLVSFALGELLFSRYLATAAGLL